MELHHRPDDWSSGLASPLLGLAGFHHCGVHISGRPKMGYTHFCQFPWGNGFRKPISNNRRNHTWEKIETWNEIQTQSYCTRPTEKSMSYLNHDHANNILPLPNATTSQAIVSPS